MVGFLSLLIAIALSPICSFAGSHSSNQALGSAPAIRSACDNEVVESYCEASGMGEIINLDGYCMANRITAERGHVKMVRDSHSNNKNTYAKNVEE